MRDASNGLDRVLEKKWQKAIQAGAKIPAKLYAAEDDVWKIYAFENEKARYRKAFPDMDEGELDKRVAQIIRDTYPTYSMIPRGVRKLRRFPLVGTFVSFPSEVMRTGYKTLGLAFSEMQDPATRSIGMQRLAGLALASTLTTGITFAYRWANKVSKEEDEARRESVSYTHLRAHET